MHWPIDHPAVVDPALAPWSDGVEAVCPSGRSTKVLRYLPGRRVASLVTTPDDEFVVKVFASPRARRQSPSTRAATPSGGRAIPRPVGVDPAGHVSAVEWVPGEVFDQLPDEVFVTAARSIGTALRRLHQSTVILDRTWTVTEELAQLERRAPIELHHDFESMSSEYRVLGGEPLVTAHRDCHPRQVVVAHGAVHWIDLDDAAMAPAGLDVGNMVAHLRRDAAIGARALDATDAAIEGFLQGYGPVVGDVVAWERLALLRLAGLAITRHQRPDWSSAVVGLLNGPARRPSSPTWRESAALSPSGSGSPTGRPGSGRSHRSVGTRS